MRKIWWLKGHLSWFLLFSKRSQYLLSSSKTKYFTSSTKKISLFVQVKLFRTGLKSSIYLSITIKIMTFSSNILRRCLWQVVFSAVIQLKLKRRLSLLKEYVSFYMLEKKINIQIKLNNWLIKLLKLQKILKLLSLSSFSFSSVFES